MTGLIPCTCLWTQDEGGRYVREVDDPGCPAAAFHAGRGAREDAGEGSSPQKAVSGAESGKNEGEGATA